MERNKLLGLPKYALLKKLSVIQIQSLLELLIHTHTDAHTYRERERILKMDLLPNTMHIFSALQLPAIYPPYSRNITPFLYYQNLSKYDFPRRSGPQGEFDKYPPAKNF